MRIAITNPMSIKKSKMEVMGIPLERALAWAGLVFVMVLAGVLRFTNLASLGYANHYYAAAVTSMSQSWHNFFFVAAEPGGSVSVDKPPVGLWLQAASAAIFGVNYFGLLFPEVMAGVLSVMLLYHLVRRSFATAAGLVAGLGLALAPVAVATDRNNTMDSILILVLLLAAWAFIKATESGKLRFLMLGGLAIGIGFNIKMLQAFLPLPAFYVLYLLGSSDRMRPRLGKLAAVTVVLVVVSASWMTIVDLTPVDQRPYVGSSGNNTVINLAIGYNGVDRLLGMGANRGIRAGSPLPGAPSSGFNPPSLQPGGRLQGNPGARQGDGRDGFGGGFNGGGPGGSFGTGRVGPLRLFTAPLDKEVGWLLPPALLGMALLLFSNRLKWPVSQQHQAVLLWGGWLVTGGVFFSIAGFFHEYYLAMLAPPAAALTGIGLMALWHLRERNLWLSIFLITLVSGGSMVYQVYLMQSFMPSIAWMPVLYVLFTLGVILLVVEGMRRFWMPKPSASVSVVNPETESGWGKWTVIRSAGLTCLVAVLLINPGIWSVLTNANSSSNQSLPAAYDGRSSGPGRLRGLQVNLALLNYLQENTKDNKYLMAVPSSMQGADYVLASGRPVLYMGGFMGQDNVVTTEQLQKLVQSGDLRFIYWGGGRMGAQSAISQWVASTCKIVTGYETASSNSGAPDGTLGGGGGNVPGGFGNNMQITLYDCGGKG